MKTIITTLMLLMTIAISTAFCEDKSNGKMKQMELTQEQRNSMATAHENMATCLRTDKSIESCREEMMKTCTDTLGKDGCPHMMGKMRKGMMKYK